MPPRGFAARPPDPPGAQPQALQAHSAGHSAEPAADCSAAAPHVHELAAAPPQLLLRAPSELGAPALQGSAQTLAGSAGPAGRAPAGERCRVADVVQELLRALAPTCEALGVSAEVVTAPPAAPVLRPSPAGASAAASAQAAAGLASADCAAGGGALEQRGAGAIAPAGSGLGLLPRPVRPLLAGVPAAGLHAALELLLDSALQRSPRGGRLEVALAPAPGRGVALDISDSGDFSMVTRMRAALRGGGGAGPQGPGAAAAALGKPSHAVAAGHADAVRKTAGSGVLPRGAAGDAGAAGDPALATHAGDPALATQPGGPESAESMLQRITRGLPASAGAVTLALGRATVCDIGGRVSVDAAPGTGGTRMRVWLPPPEG